MLNPFTLPCTGAKVVNKEPNEDSLGQRRLAGRGKTAVPLLPPDKEAPVLEKQTLNRRQKQLQKQTIKKPLQTTKQRQQLQQVVKARVKPIGTSPQKNWITIEEEKHSERSLFTATERLSAPTGVTPLKQQQIESFNKLIIRGNSEGEPRSCSDL